VDPLYIDSAGPGSYQGRITPDDRSAAQLRGQSWRRVSPVVALLGKPRFGRVVGLYTGCRKVRPQRLLRRALLRGI
jgi:hypothetical protein